MTNNVFKWSRRGAGYEVSSKGDERFSAFNAIMPCGRSIEKIYQLDIKGYDPGGHDWSLGKGKPPLDPTVDLWKEYLNLWRIWSYNNILLMRQLYINALPTGNLTDMFATTDINQAHALSVILNELIEKGK